MKRMAKPDRFTEELVSDLAAAERRSFPMISPVDEPRISSIERRLEIIELKMERAGLRGSTMEWSRNPEEQDRFRDEHWARMRRLAEIDKRLVELEAER